MFDALYAKFKKQKELLLIKRKRTCTELLIFSISSSVPYLFFITLFIKLFKPEQKWNEQEKNEKRSP